MLEEGSKNTVRMLGGLPKGHRATCSNTAPRGSQGATPGQDQCGDYQRDKASLTPSQQVG